jgi:arylsulfatase A-like enzyme
MSIDRRQFLKLSACSSLYAALGNLRCSRGERSTPNILLIYADDLGYGDLGCYGGDIPTPHIDSIAESGIRFSQFYVTSPACTPSRYSLLTGCYPHRSIHGLSDVYFPGDEMHIDSSEITLPRLLKTEGYDTAIFGKWHLGKARKEYLPMSHGFDQFSGMPGGCIDYFRHSYGPVEKDWYVDNGPQEEEGYATELIGSHALEYLSQPARKENPFFVYLAFTAPHYGKTDVNDIPPNTLNLKQTEYRGHQVMNTLQAPEAYLNRFSHIKDIYRRYYTAMVSCMDDQIGRLLDLLDSQGLRENTMIWFISDNGGYSESYFKHADNGILHGEKAMVYEGGVRIPAMVSWKERIKPGQVNDEVLSTMDMVPTMAKILGFQEKLNTLPIDGKDMSGTLFHDEAMPERPLVFGWDGKYSIRYGRWKLVHGEELYDLENDVSESNNLAAVHPEIARSLLKEQQRILSYKKYNKGEKDQP